jgi:hypothetical protein
VKPFYYRTQEEKEAAAAKAREFLTPSGMAITCGECGKTSDALEWTRRHLGGDLPKGVFQCPKCRVAFRRVGKGVTVIRDAQGKPAYCVPEKIELQTVQSEL